EIGYLPISRTGAMLFFQLMARRYETASTILTSNKGFEEWGEIFGDEVMAAALIDRLLHHCNIVSIRGNSYRMRHHTELYRALAAERKAPAPAPGRKASRREAPTPGGRAPPPLGVRFSIAQSVRFSTAVDTPTPEFNDRATTNATEEARMDPRDARRTRL